MGYRMFVFMTVVVVVQGGHVDGAHRATAAGRVRRT